MSANHQFPGNSNARTPLNSCMVDSLIGSQQDEVLHHEWVIFRHLIKHLADKTLNPLAVIEGFLTLLKEGDDQVCIDLLIREAESVHLVWQKLIAISQNNLYDTRTSPLDLFPNE